MKLHVLALLLAFAAPPAWSDGPDEKPPMRSPGDMSLDERASMMSAANEYNTCVYNEAIDKIDADPDIRRIADLAMGHCQPRLEALRAQIENWGFETYFAEGFTRTVRDRAAHRLLPELVTRKSR